MIQYGMSAVTQLQALEGSHTAKFALQFMQDKKFKLTRERNEQIHRDRALGNEIRYDSEGTQYDSKRRVKPHRIEVYD